MAVDRERQRDDLYAVRLRDHDERVELRGWVYYVRGVKREAELTRDTFLSSSWGMLDLTLALVDVALTVSDRWRTWRVGVVRLGSVRTWRSLTPKVVHVEKLPRGVDPTQRIQELVEDVKRGKFQPR